MHAYPAMRRHDSSGSVSTVNKDVQIPVEHSELSGSPWLLVLDDIEIWLAKTNKKKEREKKHLKLSRMVVVFKSFI